MRERESVCVSVSERERQCVCVCVYIYIYMVWVLLNFVIIDWKITAVRIMWNCVLKSIKSVQRDRPTDVMACHCGWCVVI